MTTILTVDPRHFTLRSLQPASRALLAGGVVGAATDSFYGLMALADQASALGRLIDLKGQRGADDAFLLLVDSRERVKAYAQEIPPEAEKLMDAFWPGLLTILLKAQSGLQSAILGKNKSTVGVRVDGFPVARALVRLTDRAVTGTSANPRGLPPARDPETVIRYFGERVDLIVDTGPALGDKPSTVIDLSKAPFTIQREGAIGSAAIQKVLPEIGTA
ncbi:MAG: threonylcarbamoyl-AMP synthase [Deltaproteobacteria bacterium]|nr:threonylcarbamoyl-AMP synthase [Deltaproteobacteria bacterium]